MNKNLYATALNQLNQLLHIKDSHSCITRFAGSWKQRVIKREDIKEQVTRYVGKSRERTQRVYVWGCSTTGALGIPEYMRPFKGHSPITKIHRPARMKFMNENDFQVYDVACGHGYTIYAVKKAQKHCLLATGINTDSQIGYHEVQRNSGRTLDYIISPVQIALPLNQPETTKYRSISCGRAHTVIATDNSGVYSLGNNSYGQCARGIVEDEIYSKNARVNVIEDVPDNIIKVECGQDHTLFITDNGEVYGCGLGADGQTGLGNYNNQGRPVQLGGDIQGEHIVSVSSKGDCVLAVSESGEVFGWGNSEYSQLAMVTKETQVNVPRRLPVAENCGKLVKAVAGGSICAVLNDKGEVYVWGYGILGKGPNLDMSIKPTQIPKTLFGENELQPKVSVVDIKCGMSHFLAITDKGEVYAWGKNREGCIGLGAYKDQFFPLKVSVPAEVSSIYCGVDHSVVIGKSFS